MGGRRPPTHFQVLGKFLEGFGGGWPGGFFNGSKKDFQVFLVCYNLVNPNFPTLARVVGATSGADIPCVLVQSDSIAWPMTFGSTLCRDVRVKSCTEPRSDDGGVPLLGSEGNRRVRETIVASTVQTPSKSVEKRARKTTSYVRVIYDDAFILSVIGADVSSIISSS